MFWNKKTKTEDRVSDADAIARTKVQEEYSTLMFGKDDMSLVEVDGIRDYAKKRTDLYKEESELTPEQRAWKRVYILLGEEIEKMIGKEKRENIDSQKATLDHLNFAKNKLEESIELGREIERTFFLQWSIITMNWEPEENVYKKSFNELGEKVFKDTTLTDAERLDGAHKMLERSKMYREKIMKMLHDYHDSIYAGLTKFEAMRETPFFKSIGGGDKEKEWLKLSWDLYKSRTGAITAVDLDIDVDEILSNRIIKYKGGIDQQTTNEEKKELEEKLVSYGYLRKAAYEFTRDVEPERVKISEACFGKLEDYIKNEK